MKKLKSKVFWTIFIILTCFLISILSLFNYQDYNREKINIKNNLNRLHNNINKDIKYNNAITNNQTKQPEEQKKDFSKKIFMDITVYTILLDENNNIKKIFSHNEETINKDKITSLATKILNSNNLKKIEIGNLYISNYSYSFQNKFLLTIIDNKEIKKKLLSSLKISLLSFFLLEIVIICLSKIVTSWIIKPVEISFNKQKQFIADASHELKTPIAVIMANADALEEDIAEKKWLNNIKNETVRMNKLVSDLLDLAKLEHGETKKIYNLNDLSKIIEMQILTFESLAFEHNLSLKYEITKEITFNCNSNQMKQLISILLDNAIKHSDQKETIKIKLYKEKSNIILTITNKGQVIPKEEQEKIFERFYRLDKSRNRKENRYGLGLAIAKNIVLNHNGKISANSTDGYTTFKVVLKK